MGKHAIVSGEQYLPGNRCFRSVCVYDISELDQMLCHACLGTLMCIDSPILAHNLLYKMSTLQQAWCLASF